MPCAIDGDDAIYTTRMTPRALLDMGPTQGVSIRAERRRDGHPYKRYVTSPCKRQRDWPQIRAHMRRAMDEVKRTTHAEIRAQARYDAHHLHTTLPPLLQKLRDFRGAGNRAILAPLADRIDALDEQGMVAIAPYLQRNNCVRVRSDRKKRIDDRPSLKEDKEHLQLMIKALEEHSVQLAFAYGNDTTTCPRLRVGPADERADPYDQSPFVPSLTVIAHLNEGRAGRTMCVPWEAIRPAANIDPIEYLGESVQGTSPEGVREFVDGTGRGPPRAMIHRIFPANNNAMHANPVLVPALRLRRIARM